VTEHVYLLHRTGGFTLPIGTFTSLSEAISAATRIIENAGVEPILSPKQLYIDRYDVGRVEVLGYFPDTVWKSPELEEHTTRMRTALEELAEITQEMNL
jgi:hypothetical protein